MSIFNQYIQDYASLDGWFNKTCQGVWDALLSFQKEAEITGNMLEIGVWKGKSAVLQVLHANPDESCFFVEPYLSKETKNLIKKSNENCQCHFYELMSDEIINTDFYQISKRKLRWIHIDGEHTGPAVINDLKIAHELLNKFGVICIDDFFQAQYPQITRAVFKYLEQNSVELQLFFCGYNKGYICRTEAHNFYLSFMKERLLEELSKRDLNNIQLCKTAETSDLNCFGLIGGSNGPSYRGPDWATDKITI